MLQAISERVVRMSASLIEHFGRPIAVSSGDMTAGSYDGNGMWVEPTRTLFTVIASVQNLSAKELLLKPEGDRQKEWLKLYSTYRFKVQKDGALFVSDIVTIDGRVYQVMSCADWSVHSAMDINYYRADIVSINPNPS